jgi:hypothetical protein
LFDRNRENDPTPGYGVGQRPSFFAIHFIDWINLPNMSPQNYYKYSSASGDQIVVDLVAAYGSPIKMSFSVV